VVVAQAHVHQPLLGQLQRVEHVQRVGVGLGVGAGVVARDRTVPRIVRVRVRQRGAVVIARGANHRRCAVAAGRHIGRTRRGVGVDVVRGFLALLACVFDTGGEAVLETGHVEGAEQVGLVGGGFGVAHPRVGPTPDAAVVDVALAVVRLGEDVILHAAAVAQGVLDGQRIVQVVLDGEGRGVGAALAEVAIQTIEVVVIAPGVWLVRVGLGACGRTTGWNGVRDARVRGVVAFQMVVVEVYTGIGAQAEGQRRRDAPTVVIDLVATGDVALVAHQVETAGSAVVELVVAVEGVALGLVGAVGEAAVEGVAQVRFLAHQVDAAAGRATTANRRVRAFADFDVFHGEDFTALRTGVAHAVQIGVALGVEAADERTVALRVAAFTSTEGNARHGTQGVLHIQRAGVLEHLLRDDGDRARGVDQRCGVLGRGGFFDLIGGRVLGFACDGGGVQGNGVAGSFALGFFRREDHLPSRAGGDCDTDCRGEQTW